MINRTKITSKITGLVGWENPINPTYAVVDATNQTSRSGRKFTDNPFVKIELLKNTQDYKSASNAQFNTYLLNAAKTAIISVGDKVCDKPDFIDRQILYPYPNNKIDIETPSGFVGYRIQQSKEKNLAIEISRVILEFKESCDIKLLLFNTAKSAPIFSKEIKYTAEVPADGETPAIPGTDAVTAYFHEEQLNWVCYNEDIYKGDYYFGYIANAAHKPFKRNYENSNVRNSITFLNITPVQVLGHNTEVLFNLSSISNVAECHGINLDISVYYDYTDSLIQNQNLLARAIQLEGQVNALTHYIATMRSNADERKTKEIIGALLELEGADVEDGPKKVGLKNELMMEMNRLRKEINRMNNGYFAHGLELNTLE